MLDITFLKQKARDIRISIIEMLVSAGSGHTAGALGMTDIFTYLYFYRLAHNPKDPKWEQRDRFVLSNGHINPVLYATLAHAGYFDIAELVTLRKYGSRLQGHPHREFSPFVETSSGPLGSGLSQSIGMALGLKMDRKPNKVYCTMSDGELQEGNTWEAIMLGGRERPDNLVAIVDRNYIQIDGNTEDILPLEPLDKKWLAFGWHVIEINGNDFAEIDEAFTHAWAEKRYPSVILAKTTPGKGVKAWENDYRWHGKPPTKEEAELAIAELKKQIM